jgi:hypothetical protein
MLTLTNGPRARADAAWMAWASSSLPVPVSPSSSTGLLDCAARRAWRLTSTAAALVPMKLAKVYLDCRLPALCFSRWVASSRRASSRSRCSQRELGDQRLQIGLGLVEQHDAQRADHRAVGVAQRNAADDEGAGAVGQQVDQDRLAGFEHLVHLGVLHHGRHRMADKILFAREPQRRQEAAVLVVDPDHAGLAVHQQHALAGVGEQVEHRARGQLQNALRIPREIPRGRRQAGHGGVHAAMLPRRTHG